MPTSSSESIPELQLNVFCMLSGTSATYTYDLTYYPHVIFRPDRNRCVARVFWPQLNPLFLYGKALHRGFIAQQRDDYIATFRYGLSAHYDDIAILDTSVVHTVTFDC